MTPYFIGIRDLAAKVWRDDNLLRRVRFWLVAASIVHAGLAQYSFGTFNFDKIEQVAAARSLADGHSLTSPRLVTGEVRRTALVAWPFGYSLALVPLLHVVDRAWPTTFLLDLAFILLFVLAWARLLDRHFDLRSGVTVWLFWAVVGLPLRSLTSSDLIAVSLLSAAVALGTCVPVRSSFRIGVAALAGSIVAMSGAVRYAYWPFVAAQPLAFVVISFASRDRRRHLVSAAAHASSALVGLAAVIVIERMLTGATSRFATEEGTLTPGFFPQNLLRLYPFPLTAFGADTHLAAMLWKLHRWSLLPMLWVIASPILGFYFAELAKRIFHEWSLREGASAIFDVSGLAIVAITLGELAALSLRYPLAAGVAWTADGRWTFVEEVRYFAPTFAFLFTSAVSFALRRNSPRLVRLFLLCVALLALASTAWVWSSLCWKRPTQPWYEAEFRGDMSLVEDTVRTKARTGGDVIYVDDDPVRRSVALMAGAAVISTGELPPGVATKATTLVTVSTNTAASVSLQHILGQGNAVLVGATAHFEIWMRSD